MSSIRVGLDISALDPQFKQHAQRGIGRYVRELKSYFDGLVTTPPRTSVATGYFDHTHFKAGQILDGLIQCAPLGRETIRQQIVYPLKLGRGAQSGFDVLHFPAHMDAPSWSPIPYLITVLDLIPIICRDLYEDANASWRFHLARWLELRAIRNAQRVLVISENTGRDVHRILGVPWERISVTPLGVSDHFFNDIDPVSIHDLCHTLGIDQKVPRILYVGGIDQRKNWGYMLDVLAGLRGICREHGRQSPQLILAGKIADDKQYPLLKAAIERLNLEDLVKEVGYVADEQLPALYASASVFFFPSLYEGFGLPPLEALATGTAVVSSNTSVMPEILGHCAEYVTPTDVTQGIMQLYQSLFVIPQTEELRQRRRAQARLYTWKRTGDSTLGAYETYASEIANGKAA